VLSACASGSFRKRRLHTGNDGLVYDIVCCSRWIVHYYLRLAELTLGMAAAWAKYPHLQVVLIYTACSVYNLRSIPGALSFSLAGVSGKVELVACEADCFSAFFLDLCSLNVVCKPAAHLSHILKNALSMVPTPNCMSKHCNSKQPSHGKMNSPFICLTRLGFCTLVQQGMQQPCPRKHRYSCASCEMEVRFFTLQNKQVADSHTIIWFSSITSTSSSSFSAA
jgi:hypothetical protein